MRTKAQPRTQDVERINGQSNLELSERCPEQRASLPTVPCSNQECPWSVRGRPYMNCSFVVFEAVAQTAKKLSLEEIGEMEGLTREGVRQIEMRALKKIRLRLPADGGAEAPRMPGASLQSADLPLGW